jgi:hypothetical protein
LPYLIGGFGFAAVQAIKTLVVSFRAFAS